MKKILYLIGSVAALVACQKQDAEVAPQPPTATPTSAANDLLAPPSDAVVGTWSNKYKECRGTWTDCAVAVTDGERASSPGASQAAVLLNALETQLTASPEQVSKFVARADFTPLNPALTADHLPKALFRQPLRVTRQELPTGTFYFFLPATGQQRQPVFVLKTR